jgi:hypothetical protein
MNPSENKKHLDELLAKTVGRSPLKFDFDTWKQQHSQEIGEYRATCKSGASLTDKRTTKMKSLILKFAVAAGIIIAALIGIGLFGTFGANNVVFADVLRNIQNRTYSFEVLYEGQGDKPFRAMIKEPGMMRMDATISIGRISSISDFNSGKTLILFHHNKSAVMMDNSILVPVAGEEDAFNLFSRPVSALWNLKDGTEKSLGTKEIDGRKAAGFAVSQEDEYFQYEISIWAQIDTSIPCLVEVIATTKQEKQEKMAWSMQHFQMDAQVDDSQFSLQPPAGYTLAYQKSLAEMSATGTSSPTAKQIENALSLWSRDKKNEAANALIGIDWTQPITFGGKPTIFTLTEKDCITLKPDEHQKVFDEMSPSFNDIKNFGKYLVTQGQAAMTAGDMNKAEIYFSTCSHLGELLCKNPDLMVITRLVGIAVQKLSLNQLIPLYTQTNNQEKLQAAQKQMQMLDTWKDEIKRQASGQ